MRIFFSLHLLVVMLFSFTAHADTYGYTDTVHTLETSAHDLWGDSADYMLVNNFKNAGSCPTDTGGLVYIVLPNTQRIYATALAAKMSGKKVTVSIDDTRKNAGGWCILRWISVAD